MTDTPHGSGVGPEQYDRTAVNNREAHLLRIGDTPLSAFHERTLGVSDELFRGKRVLDVGCGGGWLLARAIEHGATCVAGVEPSQLIHVAEERLKADEVYLEKTTFEEFEIEGKFDVIAFVMSTEHMPNLPSILQKARQIMTDQGQVIVITADMTSFIMPRFDYVVESEVVIPHKEMKITTHRPTGYGDTTDLVRTVKYWQECAELAGLALEAHSPVFADEQFISAKGWQQFELFADKGEGSIPLFQYFRFSKAV